MDDNTQTQQSSGGTQDPQFTGGTQDPQTFNQNSNPIQDQSMTPQGATQQQGGGLSDIMEKDVDISNLVQNASSNQQQSQALFNMLPLAAHPNTTFDERYFVELLAGSISLTYNEKVKILENVPKLSQYQVDELIKIFEEEKGKFAELEKKHAEQIAAFEKEHVVNSQKSVEDKQEEENRRRQEEEEQMRIMQQLQGGTAANDGHYDQDGQRAA